MTSYTVLILGPPDTLEQSRFPVVEVSRFQTYAIFKVEKQLSVEGMELFSMEFRSALTPDQLAVNIHGIAKSGSQTTFPGQTCKFQLKKEFNDQSRKYSLNSEDCQSKPEDHASISTLFSVKLVDAQYSVYGRYFTELLPKEYVDKTDKYLSLNEANMRRDGFQAFEAYFQMWVTNEDILSFYGWKVALM